MRGAVRGGVAGGVVWRRGVVGRLGGGACGGEAVWRAEGVGRMCSEWRARVQVAAARRSASARLLAHSVCASRALAGDDGVGGDVGCPSGRRRNGELPPCAACGYRHAVIGMGVRVEVCRRYVGMRLKG